MDKFISIHDKEPNEIGWYPVLLCWSIREGFFPSSAFWNGNKFNEGAASHFINKIFISSNEAEDYAYKNDPNW